MSDWRERRTLRRLQDGPTHVLEEGGSEGREGRKGGRGKREGGERGREGREGGEKGVRTVGEGSKGISRKEIEYVVRKEGEVVCVI